MPYRKVPLATGEIYHVFNRSVAKQPIFLTDGDYNRALEVINFYRFGSLPLRFSHYKRLPTDQRKDFTEDLTKTGRQIIVILSFCLMPNHFHFLLKPLEDKATSIFMRKFQDSYSKYFNTKQKRTGSLFQAMFKAVRIETDDQLIHVSRYIHLNPTSSHVVKAESLSDYPWSSYKEFIKEKNEFITDTKSILDYFKSRESYKKFVLDQADYQSKLDLIKHLALE